MTVALAMKTKRSDRHFCNPNELIVKEELRGRHMPPTDEQIMQLAVSLLTEGQQQPINARRNENNEAVVVSGFTRTAAARLIRHGFTYDGQEYKDENFLIQFIIQDCNDEEAFRRNIVENSHRNQTSPIDDAHNQRKLRENYGMSDAEIARLFRYAPAKVANYKRLLMLSREEQVLVHEGKLGVSAALDLLDVEAEKRQEIVAQATTDSGKVNGAMIREQVRDTILNDDNKAEIEAETDGFLPGQPEVEAETEVETEPQKPEQKRVPTKTRSMREVKKALESIIDNENTSAEVRDFCKTLMKFCNGSVQVRSLENALNKIAKAA
jgi:ParB/RepB/Spo0J family partition protein